MISIHEKPRAMKNLEGKHYSILELERLLHIYNTVDPKPLILVGDRLYEPMMPAWALFQEDESVEKAICICGMGDTLIQDEAWNFPIEELDYLLEEHNRDSFVLMDNRLWEAEDTESWRRYFKYL